MVRPNLLYVVTDHQRADSLNMVQCGIEVTPNLNMLATKGVAFERAYNVCPLCVPARTSFSTGLYPLKNGITINKREGVEPQNHKPIHQYLSEAGYTVGHVGVHHVRVKPDIKERVNFKTWVGVEEHDEYCLKKDIDLNAKELREPYLSPCLEDRENGDPVPTRFSNTNTGPWPGETEDYKDAFFTQAALNFLDNTPQEPFALFVNLWAPHPPLWVPEEYKNLFDPDKIELPPYIGQPASGEPISRRKSVPAQLAEGLTEKDWRKTWSAHLALVHLADKCLGKMINKLEDMNILDSTICVFHSDHGDHMGQHSMYQKMEMYEQAVRTPLVIKGIGDSGYRFKNPVSHLDILPTILDYADIKIPNEFDGISLKPFIESNIESPERTIFGMYDGNFNPPTTRRMAVTKTHKYVYTPNDADELFDLTLDPNEMKNIAQYPTNKELLKSLYEETRAWHEAMGDNVFI
ncbi:MAG: hypothetical protein COA79_09145 [Planctomycetota bacterium]|nr:MAG: hypothetical protein COA79_09145 [Planctomycetota bacterium]